MASIAYDRCHAASHDDGPSWKIELRRKDDRAEVEESSELTQLDIRSPFGISHAVVHRSTKPWPAKVRVRLHLRGLEQLRLVHDAVTLETAFSSQRLPQTITLRQPDKSELSIDKKHPLWFDVLLDEKNREAKNPLPLKEGYFEFVIPKAFLADDVTTCRIEWIDFFR
jgi:hypothetical protein